MGCPAVRTRGGAGSGGATVNGRLRFRIHRALEAPWPVLRAGERLARMLLVGVTLAAVLGVMVEETYGDGHAAVMWVPLVEGLVTVLFAGEYALRLWVCVEDPRFAGRRFPRLRYALTPGALVDLLAILPGVLWLFGVDLRSLRILRLLRVLALTHFAGSLELLTRVLRAEAEALFAAFTLVLVVLVLAATGIHLFEAEVQPEHFGTVARALWWAVVTVTTVGYGDVVPVTTGGRLFAGLTSLLGIALFSIPTAILAAGFVEQLRVRRRAYRRLLELALADGRLTPEEAERLEEIRLELGLPAESAAADLVEVLRRCRSVRDPDPRTERGPADPAPDQSSGTVPRKRAKGETPPVRKR